MSYWTAIGETFDDIQDNDSTLGTSPGDVMELVPSDVTERRIATSGNNTWPLVAASNERETT